MREDYFVRFGNDKDINRSYYSTKEDCEKLIKNLENAENITWFELIYEPIEEEGAQYIIQSGEKEIVDVLGQEVVINLW